MDTKLAMGVAVVAGAAATWLWTRHATQPAVELSTATPHIAPQSLSPMTAAAPSLTAKATPSRSAPQTTPDLKEAPKHPASVTAPIGSRDDSTFDKMLATAQTYPEWLNIAGNLTRMHERFVLTPDDPAWARPMEQSLRDFFNARTEGKPFEFTSISCHSKRCEVQVQVELDRQVEPGGEAARQQQRMLEPVHDTRPLGHSVLRQDAIERVAMGDRVAMLISYEQVEPETADAQ